jgi:hypothetical protein
MTTTERAVLLFRIRNGVKLLLIVITFTMIAILVERYYTRSHIHAVGRMIWDDRAQECGNMD